MSSSQQDLNRYWSEIIGNFMADNEKALATLRAAVGQAFSDVSTSLAKQMEESWSNFLAPAFDQLTEELAKFQDTLVILAPFLSDTGFWISPSMSVVFVNNLIRVAKESGATQEVFNATFVNRFEANKWELLNRFVENWRDNKYFAPRMRIIEDALEAHVNGKFTLSIPTLFAQAEGIASEILNSPTFAGRTGKIMTKVVEDKYGDWAKAVSKNILLDFIQSNRGFGRINKEHFTRKRFLEWLESTGRVEEDSANRHAVLHGVQINYATKENSLRCFLLLDMLSGMESSL